MIRELASKSSSQVLLLEESDLRWVNRLSVKIQLIVNIPDPMGYSVVSITVTQFCHWSLKEVAAVLSMNVHSCFSIKLYKNTRARFSLRATVCWPLAEDKSLLQKPASLISPSAHI